MLGNFFYHSLRLGTWTPPSPTRHPSTVPNRCCRKAPVNSDRALQLFQALMTSTHQLLGAAVFREGGGWKREMGNGSHGRNGKGMVCVELWLDNLRDLTTHAQQKRNPIQSLRCALGLGLFGLRKPLSKTIQALACVLHRFACAICFCALCFCFL